jgi:kynurenine formamidase
MRALARRQASLRRGAGQFRGRRRAPVDPEVFHPCHQRLIMKHGIYLREGMILDGQAEREAYVFVYVFAPLPIVGATGSPGNPLAVL